MPIFIGRTIIAVRLASERRVDGIEEPVLTTLRAVVRNALGLQKCLNKVLGRGAFGQRNIACRAPASIVAVDIGTDNIDRTKNLARKGIAVASIHKGDGVTLLELVGTSANVLELAIYVEAPIAIGRSIIATIGLTIEGRINAVEEPAPRRFASIESKADLLKEILGSGACLEARLARRSPNLLLAVLFHKNLLRADHRTIICGVILGVFLCLSYQFQTYGLKYTTASKNAFITTLYVIIVPFLYWIVSKKRPGGRNIAAAFLAVIGLALLSLQGDLSINYGDLLTLVCGLMFAVHMVFIDKFTETQDPIALTVIQILAAAIFNWGCAPFLDGTFDFAVLLDKSLLSGLLYLSVFSTTVAYLLQNSGQKYLSASTSAILLSMESVFGTLFSVIFLKDVLTGKMIAGCALMFAAVLLSELPQKKQ